ncbi:MAG: hypothetical protein GX667_04950 [Xanthomonadaceae bacterium]|nr:hypothetical protein [Xanthomonadaceae bacterium]
MKKILPIAACAFFLAGCIDTTGGVVKPQMVKGSALTMQADGVTPAGAYEFMPGRFTESDLLRRLTEQRLVLEECGDVECVADRRDQQRAIKLREPREGEIAPGEFKYGDRATTYLLYNYRVDNRFVVDKIALYFLDGRLALATMQYPETNLINAIQREAAPSAVNDRTVGVLCRMDGQTRVRRAQKVTQSDWRSGVSDIYLSYMEGELVRPDNCEYDARGQKLLLAHDSSNFATLEREHKREKATRRR